jgi:hypothetical protein
VSYGKKKFAKHFLLKNYPGRYISGQQVFWLRR